MTALHDEYVARQRVWSDIYEHLGTLYARAAAVLHPTVIELGVRSGNSTAAFLAAVEAQDGHLWSVDIEEPSTLPIDWFDLPFWHLLTGDDLDPMVATCLPLQCDVLFIDTSHTYRQTLAELRLYGRRVVLGGVILLHDTELETPEAAGSDDPPFPVACAVRDWCDETGNSYRLHAGNYGLGEITVRCLA